MKKHALLLFVALIVSIPFYAAQIDTIYVKSNSMDKDVKVVVVTPTNASDTVVNYPTVYLLHGYSGNARSWVALKPELGEIADEKGIIFVCPDGKNSWYWDSPKNPSYRYETFISDELISYIDANYPTIASRDKRAITGLSMGGHGALYNAIRHKDVFGAAGSTSGGVDIRPFPNNWEMSKQLGDIKENAQLWDEYTVINQLDKLQPNDLALIFDCGTSDFFYDVNVNLHNQLLQNKIDHDFISRPGNHDGEYWENSIDYHILFFDNYFKK